MDAKISKRKVLEILRQIEEYEKQIGIDGGVAIRRAIKEIEKL